MDRQEQTGTDRDISEGRNYCGGRVKFGGPEGRKEEVSSSEGRDREVTEVAKRYSEGHVPMV